jgi:hypothetical protein
MLSSIITAALTQTPDLIVAGQVDAGQDLALQIQLTAADALIVQASRPDDAATFSPLLYRHPTLKIIAIDSATNSGFVHELRPRSLHLPELSAELIQSVLCAPLPPIAETHR